MKSMQRIPKFVHNDIRLIGRDHFLLMMLSFALLIGIVLRFALPSLNTYLDTNGILSGFNIYYPLIVAFIGFYQGPLIVGAIFGFVLLEEKEDYTLRAMLVTPVPLQHYIGYRVGMPVLFAFIISISLLLLIDQALGSFGQMVLLALGAAFTAPLISMFFATFAENKVQGFALSKFIGIAGWIIVGAWFISEPWQWIVGAFPPFWISKAYWMLLAGESQWWTLIIIGIGLQWISIWILIRYFNHHIYR
ncbi:hypothetical protein IC620_06830 [Hazenella sp. IB182357]|uniref:Fluoroquinolone transport system permease protein n=1 Tax=Polycladospora coralii TaxID=2771432 RepID=A0A926RTT0_9BACL|nr:hypothetical protein [Polycladospora coralii]MBD1372073.1 hypothetical protein [Polycladospora coralii]MBS7530579.1 hypothetical protein [Polycladospora coralii]